MSEHIAQSSNITVEYQKFLKDRVEKQKEIVKNIGEKIGEFDKKIIDVRSSICQYDTNNSEHFHDIAHIVWEYTHLDIELNIAHDEFAKNNKYLHELNDELNKSKN